MLSGDGFFYRVDNVPKLILAGAVTQTRTSTTKDP